MNRLIIIFSSFLFTVGGVLGQESYPVIGEPMFDFEPIPVNNYRKSEISTEEFKGRYVIIDFWNKYCSSCITGFPKVSELSAMFKDKVDIILVGQQDHGIEKVFEKVKQKQNLNVSYAFDSVLYNQCVFAGAPLLIWIDPEGIIKAITTKVDLTESKVQSFIEGKPFVFRDRSYAAHQKEENFDVTKAFLINDNGGDDANFLFRSLLCQYRPGMPYVSFAETIPGSFYKDKNIAQGVGNLPELYRIAYFGKPVWTTSDSMYPKYYYRPVLKVKDPSKFHGDDVNGNNYYWYSLVVPPDRATTEYMMSQMQRDLLGYFGYEASIEHVKLPYWKLTATREAKDKLLTKGGQMKINFEHSGAAFRNVSMKIFCRSVFGPHSQIELPILDKTGIDHNIDVEIDAIITSFEDLKTELQKHGLYLRKAKKKFYALVISDGAG